MMRYVLDDVRNQYDSLGRIDLMKDLALGVERLRSSAPASKGNKTNRDEIADAAETANMHHLMGDIAFLELRLPDALPEFRSAEQILRGNVQRLPSQSTVEQHAFVHLLCKAQSRIVQIEMKMGQMDRARSAMKDCQLLLAAMPRPIDPDALLYW
jgi:hypothetical protein